jgi:hypothetical protein
MYLYDRPNQQYRKAFQQCFDKKRSFKFNPDFSKLKMGGKGGWGLKDDEREKEEWLKTAFSRSRGKNL